VTGAALQGALQASGVPSSSIKQFPEPVAAMHAVAGGQADCFPFYDISVRQLVADGGPVPGLESATPFELPGSAPMVSGFQFIKRDDTSIRDAFTTQLTAMRQNGQWLQIASRFGLTAGNAVPPGFSVDQVCH
jgi:polar amino acid transport system substrate-binding protein